MATGDTTMGGGGKEFPATTWGALSRRFDPTSADHRAKLEGLCRRYWRPVYRYVRIVWAKSNDDAKDLTQAFFLWLMEGDTLHRYRPEKGSFRRFLKVLLSRFLAHREEALHRLKRGGGMRPLSFDDETIADTLADSSPADADRAFDAEWVDVVVRPAVERVRRRFRESGREIQFRAFEEYDLAEVEGRRTYGDVAGLLGLKETVVRNYLFTVREEIRAEIRTELREETRDETELEEEWCELFGSRPPERT